MVLEDIRRCVSALDSNKITERKRAADLLDSLLNNKTIVASIDANSRNKKNGNVSWDRVFEFSRRFFVKCIEGVLEGESDSLRLCLVENFQIFYNNKQPTDEEAEKIERDERSKENPSVSVLRSWENQKRYAVSLPKQILNKSCRGVPHISVNAVIDFVFLILDRRDRPYLLENFAIDAIQIVQGYVFQYPQYYLHVAQGQWKDLLRFCMWVFENGIAKKDADACLSVIESILKVFRLCKSSHQLMSPSVALRPLPQFLLRVFSSSHISEQYNLQGTLLSLLYTTCFELGSQWRCCLAVIGEDTFPVILRLWENRPTPRQITLLKYINLQLIIHNPQYDGEVVSQSEFCSNALQWQKYLLQLYVLILDYLAAVDQDIRTGTVYGSRDLITVPTEFIILTARLLSQILSTSDTSASLDITQVAPGNSSTQRNKRRRIDVGFQHILDMLREEGTNKGKITWYQILSQMIRCHKAFFTLERTGQLLELFLYLLGQSKDSMVAQEMLKCLTDLFHVDESLCSDNKICVSEKWSMISDVTLRLIAGKQCSETGMRLLKALIDKEAVHVDSTLYSLFCRHAVSLSEEAMQLLESLLLHQPLPQKIKNEEYLHSAQLNSDSRKMLVKFLLPLPEDLGNETDIKSCTEVAIRYPHSLAKILYLLMLQDPVRMGSHEDCQERSVLFSQRPDLGLEQLYLNSTFHWKTKKSADDLPSDAEKKSTVRYNSDAKEMIITRLMDFALQHLPTEYEIITKEELELFLYILNLTICMMPYKRDYRLKIVFQKIDLIQKYVEKLLLVPESTRWTELLEFSKQMHLVYRKALDIVEADTASGKYLFHLVVNLPQVIQEKLLGLIKTRESTSPSNTHSLLSCSSAQSTSNSGTRMNQSQSSFDSDFDNATQTEDVIDSDFEDFHMDNSAHSWSNKNFSTVSRSNLSQRDQCILLVTEWLGLIYELNTACSLEVDEDNSPFMEAIEFYISLANSRATEDIAMVLVFVSSLFGMKYQEDNVSDGIEIISSVSRKHAKDPRIAVAAVQCLKELIVVSGSKFHDDQKTNVIHLLKVYAEKFRSGESSIQVGEAIFEAVAQLAKIDPLRRWSFFTITMDDRSGEVYNFLRCPYHDLRMKVAMQLPLLFTVEGDPGRPLPLENQIDQFQRVYQVVIESLTVEGILAPELTVDEGNSRVASFLSSLLIVALASTFLEPKVLFAIFCAAKVHQVDIGLIEKAVARLAQQNNLNTRSYVKQHLLYLLSQWIHDKHLLQEFPYCVLGFKELKPFLREYSGVITTALFHQDQQQLIQEELSKNIETDGNILLEQNFSALVASVIPYLVASAKENDDRFKISRSRIISATRKWKYLEHSLGDSKLSSLIESEVGNIIFALLQLCHDPEKWTDSEVVITPSFLYFDSSLVIATLSELHCVFLTIKTPVMRFLAVKKLSLHAVIHGLFLELAEVAAPHKSRLALAKMDTLMKTLLPNLGEELLSMNVYVVRKFIYILSALSVEFSSKQLSAMAEKCNRMLHDVVTAAVAVDSCFMITSVPTLVSRLLGLSHNKEIWPSACEVLMSVLNCDTDKMKRALAALPPISAKRDVVCMDQLCKKHSDIIAEVKKNNCLTKIVEEFLHVPTTDVTKFYLKYLSNMLTEKHTEIGELYITTYKNGKKLAHCLIHRIITVISATSHIEDGVIGIDCLGKLGPVSLETAVFALEEEPELCIRDLNNPNFACFAETLVELSRLVFTTDSKVVEAANRALEELLQTKFGYTIVQSINDRILELHMAPFIPNKKPKGTSRQTKDHEMAEYEALVQNSELWEISESFESWISKLTVSLIRTGCGCDFYSYLIPLCDVNASFCEHIFPFVVHHMLAVNPVQRRSMFSRMLNSFINKLSNRLAGGELGSVRNKDGLNLHVCRKALRLILRVINYLRTQDPGLCFSNRKRVTNWERNLWLDIDHLCIARAAYLSGSHFSAILFAEIAGYILDEQVELDKQNSDHCGDSLSFLQRRQLPILRRVSDIPRGEEISAHLLQVFNSQGESDGVEGCSGTSWATNCVVQSVLSVHRQNWMQALAISDAGQSCENLVDVLKMRGLYNVLYSVAQTSIISKDPKLLEAKAECCWRLGRWDESEKMSVQQGFHQHFLAALSNLKLKDLDSLKETEESFKLQAIKFLREDGKESTSNIYPILAQLQIFAELKNLTDILELKSGDELASRIVAIDSAWAEKETYSAMDPKVKEMILSARIAVLKNLSSLEDKRHSLQLLLFKTLIQKCQMSRDTNAHSVSEYESALLDAQKLNLSVEDSWKLRLEEAYLSLCLNNHAQAIRMLEELTRDIRSKKMVTGNLEQVEEYSQAMLLYGQILIKSGTLSPVSVIDCYFKPIIASMEQGLGSSRSIVLEDSYHQLAEYGDRLYREVNLLSSDYYKDRIRQVNCSKIEKEKVMKLMNEASSIQEHECLRKKLQFLERDIRREEDEIKKQEKEASIYLQLALRNYFKCLSCSSDHGLSIFRVIALWFENLLSEDANKMVAALSPKIKSHLFIPLLYQLVARLTGVKESCSHHILFPSTLFCILERVCTHHPHHSLPVVMMLAHSHLDEELDQQGTPARGRLKIPEVDRVTEEDRVQAAKLLVQQLQNSPLKNHICELEKLCQAYVHLAISNIKPKDENMKITLVNNHPLMRLKNFQYTAPLTRPISVQPSGSYSPPLIRNWDPTISFVGGINAPLKLAITSSDGMQTHELLKGNDDLRQDAVLEQVFSVVNELLAKNSEARKVKLNVRTYQVVPLSQKTGILQWCNNTMTLGSCLVDAHKKYHPEDLEPIACRNKLKAVCKKPAEVILQAFETILCKFHPVFHYFFLEHYPKPERWYIQRQAYTRSVAASSIAGYILGLGDRHVQNLLLDIQTAEVIHIDLGIAFENGKLLPTPERVPFRMTQDIVDGFGVLGVEGPLRKCMEMTMLVLREARSVLVTIIEVLKHDPLHHWTLTPKQIAKLQRGDSSSEELRVTQDSLSASMAERALVRVEQKLNGLQDGHILSVPEHVSVLIQQATAISNLALMFNGWQPYL